MNKLNYGIYETIHKKRTVIGDLKIMKFLSYYFSFIILIMLILCEQSKLGTNKKYTLFKCEFS